MANLANPQRAAQLWAQWVNSGYVPGYALIPTHDIVNPFPFPVTRVGPRTLGGHGYPTGTVGTLIGIGANSVAYFHLTGMSFPWASIGPTASHFTDGGGHDALSLDVNQYEQILTSTADISDGSPGCSQVGYGTVSVRPLSHTGFPTCAALPIGGSEYLAVAAMDVSNLDVATCAAAYNSAGWALGGGGGGGSGIGTIHIIIKFNG